MVAEMELSFIKDSATGRTGRTDLFSYFSVDGGVTNLGVCRRTQTNIAFAMKTGGDDGTWLAQDRARSSHGLERYLGRRYSSARLQRLRCLLARSRAREACTDNSSH